MPDLKTSLGYRYLQETKFDRETIMSRPRSRVGTTAQFKVYERAPVIQLSVPQGLDAELSAVLASRRSRRSYASRPVTFEQLGTLLWAAQGVTATAGRLKLRTSPSAGGLYPVETYVVVQNVEQVQPGLYHLNVRDWCLEELKQGDFSTRVAQAGLGQGFMAQAGLNLVWTAILRRNMAKYGHRGLRYVMLDAGHICQNLLLAAEALNLGACAVGAFFDEEFNALLDLDGQEESVIYTASVGAPGRQR